MTLLWHPDVELAIAEHHYAAVADFYEHAIAEQPNEVSHYWYLGLAYLMLHREEDAQATLFTPFLEADDEDAQVWSAQLAEILKTAAQQERQASHLSESWLIRGYLREITPDDLTNRLHFVDLSLQLYPWTPEEFLSWELTADLSHNTLTAEDEALILDITTKVLTWPEPHPAIADWIGTCFHSSIDSGVLANTLWLAATNAQYSGNRSGLGIYLPELGLKYLPNHLDLLGILTDFYAQEGRYQDAIAVSQRFYQNCHTPALKVLGASLVVKSFLNSGDLNSDAEAAFLELQESTQALLAENSIDLDNNQATALSGTLISFAYYKDRSAADYQLQNQLLRFCQENIHLQNLAAVERYKISHQQRKVFERTVSDRKLRIGYLTKSFRFHSVGWLSRWLFRYHNRDKFELFIYMIQFAPDEFSQEYFATHVDHFYSFGFEPPVNVAEKIFSDQIDILIDLDSLTSIQSVNIMALRPAPVQTTWLGWDAMGLPAIDYFMADNYVVPDNAHEFYSEKIWKLPRSYIAVEGFEIRVPTLRRDHLGIPTDAVVYLSAQKGCKRHPEHIRLQMKILKGVPGSYFLVKGLADEAIIQQLFVQIAQEEGVDPQRIQFLPRDPNEETHRANLQIADIILDTFPYNGATTTLEVLWLGIPLVTRVGNQFSARNSYGFLRNAGIEAGIAWTAEEYVEWGIRFGRDRNLREEVSWQLKRSRHHAPLWNAKQFTLDMEQAYQQMWQQFLMANAQHLEHPNLLEPLNLHIGGQQTHTDWKILDIEDRPEVDFVGNASNLSQFKDGSVHTIYASHVLEHFHYRLNDELIKTLSEWHRVLEPNGKLMISVPNLQVLCRLYSQPDITVDQRIHLMQMIFGGQKNSYDVHYVGLDFDSLKLCLEEVGFQSCEQVSEFGLFQDSSHLTVFGELISLNVIAVK